MFALLLAMLAAVLVAPKLGRATDYVFKVACLNLPGHANKRALVRPAARAVLAFSLLNKRGRTIVAIQELSSVSRWAIRKMPHWTLIDAPPNNVHGSNRVGNAIAFRNDVWTLLWASSLHQAYLEEGVSARLPRGLSLPKVTLEHKITGQRIRVLGFHAPRLTLFPLTNAAVLDLVADFLGQYLELGRAAMAIGDGNNRRASSRMRRLGAKVLVEGDVLFTAAVNIEPGTSATADTRASDHKVAMADSNPDEPA